ncbi:MAG: hypothetical protein WKI04_03725 [Ferruginibacter sp.]
MACTFSISFQRDASVLVGVIKSKILNQGGAFNGDESGGNFDVALLGSHVRGTYTIAGQQMSFVITDKPFFVSCDQIKSYIQGNVARG